MIMAGYLGRWRMVHSGGGCPKTPGQIQGDGKSWSEQWKILLPLGGSLGEWTTVREVSRAILICKEEKKTTFEEGRAQIPIHSLFNLPLSQQAHAQMIQLEMLLQQSQVNASPDKWSYIWNSSLFSVKRAYKQLEGHLVLHPVYKWPWKSLCQNKHKVFF